MKKGASLLFVLSAIAGYANIHHIDITRITQDTKLIAGYNAVKANSRYYDHWSNQWNYDKSKEELTQLLRRQFQAFRKAATNNAELELFLGDIAHYLYNLDDTAYFKLAVKHYTGAQLLNPTDFRSFCFLGTHYAHSSV